MPHLLNARDGHAFPNTDLTWSFDFFGIIDVVDIAIRTNTIHTGRLHCTTAMAFAPSLFRWAVPGAFAVGLAQASIYDVKGGTRAVIFDRLSGVREAVVAEGTHFLIPWLQRAIVFDVRTRPRNISTTTGSKDMQMVTLTLRVLHRPEVKQLPKIYQV